MSGIEVAGLVLGVIPIIISAVDIGKSTYDRTLIPFRKRSYIDQLTHALLLQRQTVREIIRLMSVHSGCIYHEDLQLNDDPIGYLKNTGIQEELLNFLGDANHEAFIGRLHETSDTLRRVANQILGLLPADQDRADDLLWIIEANREGKVHHIDFLARIKLMLRASEIKKSIKDLDAATDSLNRFSQLVLMNRSSPAVTHSSRQSVQLVRALRRVRVSAMNLYAALCRCCRRETCHSEHEANIFLEDRIDAAAEILQHSRKRVRDMVPMLVFQLIFAGHLTPFEIGWHEIPIRILDKNEDNETAPLSTKRSYVGLIDPTETNHEDLAPAQFDKSLVFVDDFCKTVTTAKNGALPIAFVLCETNRIGSIVTERATIIHQDNARRISLKTILSECGSVSYGIGFSLRLRMLLALRLASNLLQLSQTRWLDTPWSSQTIYFLLQPTCSGKRLSVDFNRAFVSATIDDSEINAMEGAFSPQPKVVLLELGILLLEIWHQTTLESHFSLDETPTEYYLRLARALEWLEDSDNPPPHLYESAISHCIRGVPGSDIRLKSWEANEFWNGVCSNILDPLSKNCKQWR